MSSLNPLAQLPALSRGMVVLVAVVLVAACSRGDASGPLPPETPTIAVDIDDDEVVYDGSVPAGRVVFHVENAGEQPHQLSLLSLADESPPVAEQLEDPPEQSPSLLARVPLLGPGETSMFAAGLAEGQRYALVDLSQASDESTYGQQGVAVEFRAGDQSQSATP